MDGLATLIILALLFSFGTPFLLLVIGLVKRPKDKKAAQVFFILAAAWLIVAGGICATLLV
ncbi:hypothetical protein [Chryseolinea lacunae]|uniref:Cardiolipin synthase N-terminal domain-containing protein n=1 Tax=Chryseolinea lacunae TaxID=2801331 RepID=A0ABS1L3U6_9BACT|nr:hypothetical protein [Chryseolinea lacunae]MBL0745236.1 hypothetical protein [Chryseolinea lacunae]